MLKAQIGMILAATLATTAASAFELTSPDIAPGAKIADEYVFNGFGCTGKNVSPALKWSGAPAGTKSFALMVYDPDAPTGSGFWHWVMFDIPPTVSELPQTAGDLKSGKAPAGGVQSRTDFGVPGYGGPCPPKGDPAHHYHFMLFAVDAPKLDADANTSAAVVGFNLHFHTLAKTEFVAVYGR
jgi:Raf kinase inhibitor-like YbhB/YbcL family protein